MKEIMHLLLIFILFSCSNINRDKLVDKKELIGNDYRLFQNTPAWELAKAVQDEDVDLINKIIAENNNLINFQDSVFGNTLLILTISNQQFKSFLTLLTNKADVNIHNYYEGTSALIEACTFKRYDIKYAELLLKYGANANDVQTDKNEPDKVKSALIKAAISGNFPLVELLINNGAKINFHNKYGQSALSESVIQQNYKVSYLLLMKGADYTSPIYYKDDYSLVKKDSCCDGEPMYLVNELRESLLDLDTEEYKYKMKIVEFLKTKGIDYRSIPIPTYIKNKVKQEYPNGWEEYLEKY